MRLRLATSIALAALTAAPAALATTPGPTPINGSYKGRTGQNLVTTFDIAHDQVKTFTTNVQRFCSDGTSSYSRIVATGLSGQSAAVRRGNKGIWKIDLTVTTSTGPTARVRGTVAKGWITGTITFSDVATLPMGPGDGDGPNPPPGTGATCSTAQSTKSNRVTFTSAWG